MGVFIKKFLHIYDRVWVLGWDEVFGLFSHFFIPAEIYA